MKWTVVSSELLFDELWFKVRKDICTTPMGKTINPYYVYEFPTWVTAFALTADGRVILERQYRHALGEVILELPGGCVDDEDKDYETAIRRELVEETGYTFSSVQYLGKTSANPSTNTNWMHFFLATGGEKSHDQALDPNEEIEVEFFTIDEVKQMLRENKFIQSMHTTCIMHALERLGELKY